jgi:anti-anti-sigma factor
MTMQQQTNKIRLQTQGEVTVLDIKGDITAFSEPFLNSAYKNSNDSGAKKILLKFEDTAYINSGGIAVLIQILAQTKRNNQAIGITGLSDHFKKVFNMVGITKFAAIHSSLDDALKAMA